MYCATFTRTSPAPASGLSVFFGRIMSCGFSSSICVSSFNSWPFISFS